MINDYWYHTIYILFVSLITIFSYNNLKNRNGLLQYINSQNEHLLCFLLSFIIAIFIGLRPLDVVFGDMVAYESVYHSKLEGVPFEWNWESNNIIFDNYFAWVGSNRLGTTFFFCSISLLYFIGAYYASKRFFPKNTLAGYLIFLAAFSTFSYGVNGIKAGAAGVIFLNALSYRNNLKICIPLMLISWGFHHSMQLPVMAFAMTLFYKNTKTYFVIWITCFAIAALHISFFQNLFSNLVDEKSASYLSHYDEDWGGKTGFRLDFIIYSAMPILVGYWAIIKKRIKPSTTYSTLLNMYLITNSAWMLCIYANFTNRIAYLSWFMYPFVLVYPYINENWGKNKYKDLSKVMLAHLSFKLIMVFIL